MTTSLATAIRSSSAGYDGDTATRLATAAGSPWSRYAPGDHEQ
ncbi:hypothetical protein [Nonomuraea sp. NPDC050202]